MARKLQDGAITMTPNRTSFLAVLLFLTLTGCINLPDIDEPKPPDTEDPKPLPDLSVKLLSPAGTTYTNGAVDVSIEVTNGTPEAVDLFAGTELLTTLTAPYTFRWDTATKPEGSYTLTAKARRGTQTFTSEERTVVVDRTPPQVLIRTPEPGSSGVSASQPIQLFFSEELDANHASNAPVRATNNGNDLAVNTSLSADGRRLQITPVTKIPLPANVSIVLTNQLRDRAGNPVLESLNAWAWSMPDFYFLGTGIRVPSKVADTPSMQLDASDNPVVAYVIGSFGYVSRWTGSAWVQVGGVLNVNPGGSVHRPSLQLDHLGAPVVAWTETTSSGSDIYVRRWNGSGWETIGGALSAVSGNTMASFPSLQIDANGNPAVAWMERDDAAVWNAYVWRWNGSSWESMGGAISAKPGNTHVGGVSLRVGTTGGPVVSWTEEGDDSAQAAYVARWTNGAWRMLGGPVSVNPGWTHVNGVSLAMDLADQPVIGVNEYISAGGAAIYLQRWTGSEWTSLGEAINPTGGEGALEVSLQIDAYSRPVVAYTRGSTTLIYIKRWTGTEWETLGGALEAMPGFSSTYFPSLQLNARGVPIIAWSEAQHTDGGVFVARFND